MFNHILIKPKAYLIIETIEFTKSNIFNKINLNKKDNYFIKSITYYKYIVNYFS